LLRLQIPDFTFNPIYVPDDFIRTKGFFVGFAFFLWVWFFSIGFSTLCNGLYIISADHGLLSGSPCSPQSPTQSFTWIAQYL
jgi:hypothetical protein